jgi:hypothetical protein
MTIVIHLPPIDKDVGLFATECGISRKMHKIMPFRVNHIKEWGMERYSRLLSK